MGIKPADGDRLSAQASDGEEGAGLDAVPHHGVRDGMKLGDALDLNDRGACALDVGAHLVEHVGEVNDLGLASRVVDDRGALGEDRGHHEVLRGSDACEGKGHGLSVDAVGRGGVDVAVIDLELNTQGLQAEDVHVDLAGADVAAARHGNDGLAEPRKKRSEHGRRGTHLDDEVVGGLPGVDASGINLENVLVNDLDLGAEVLEHLAHDVNVRDVGDVGERGHARGHERGRHKLEGRVLCSLDRDRTGDGIAALNLYDVHASSVSTELLR